jgi:4-amino-4-deoxy-L-arabinose transferase-like glycosyltransferase
VAVSFMVLVSLGWTQEAAATLVPTLFSLGSLTLLYMIGGRLWGTKVAFLSTLVMMLTPMFRKYSQLICHEPPTTFFILAVVYCYILWVETLEHRYFNLTCAFIMVGCFTGWPVYYTIPLLTVHYIIFGKSGYSKVALILPSIGLLMFSLFLIHLYVLDGETAFSKLDYGLKSRLDYGNVRRMGVLYNVKILVDYMNLVKRANTVYVFYVSGLLLLSMAYGIIRKHDVRRESYVLILISVAVIHNLIWPSGVKIHDYWSYYFTPALSLAAVAGLDSALEDIKGYGRVIVWAVFLLCFIVSSTTQF